ncbi:MAG: sulfite exporter TauE/SafE family protein [Kiritimatiellae bacterium]|nr:sulfite exporter TauE/SafE family protein [Kiritimatiellia bacterium]
MPHRPMSPGAWAAAGAAALLIGMAKCGLPGLGMLAVPLMAMVMPARQSVGALLPILLVGDALGIAFFRQHAKWGWILRLSPWVTAGLVAGAVWLSHLDNDRLRRLLGMLVLGMVALDILRRRLQWERLAHHPLATAAVGVLAGTATTLGNAAGPVMNLYLLARGLPRQEFVGTAAWFFLLVNLTKVPVFVAQQMLTRDLARLTVLMAPVVVLGGVVGRSIVHRIPEAIFRQIVLWLSALAGLRLLW